MEAKKKKMKSVSKRGVLFRTMFLLAVCGIAAFVVLAMRLYEVQIVNHNYFHARALRNQLRHSTLSASRGTVFDANGTILAMSAAVENVFISPLEILLENQDVQLIADGLSAILGVDREMIIERASRTSSQYQIIKLKANDEQARQVREFISEHRLRGVHLEPNSRRYFPHDSLAGQILGFVGTENIGLDGLELRYNHYLTGVSGRKVRMTSARGTALSFREFEDTFYAQDGYNITLTIDASIQYFVEKHLAAAIDQYRVLNGAICIAMNARTGAILAMASYPNFDPNNFLELSERELERLSSIEDEEEFSAAFRDAQFRQWRNRALTDTYEPGSVFKIITHAMALEENIATLDTTFTCNARIDVLGRVDRDNNPIPMRCWLRTGHGTLTLDEAMQRSCNVVCVELAVRLGARTFYEYIEAFGLMDRTGLDNASEARSIWWEESLFFNRHNHSQLAAASIGQTFTITPIQMITAVAAAVNGGYLMQPFLVQEISDSSGNIVRVNEPTVVRQVVSAGTSAAMRTMLENVVESGTGRNAQVKGYRIGGKTGTSENVVQIALSGDGAQKDLTASFVGVAPADNPEIVILLLLDTPSHSTGLSVTGGAMAAPVVGKMLADILPLALGIMPQYSEEDLQDINVYMPRITDRYINNAVGILMNLGLEHRVIGEGDTVTAQLPAANAQVAPGTMVVLYAGEEAPEEYVTVPNMFGMTFEGARRSLENNGLFIRTTGVPKSDRRAEVSVQSIPAGREVRYGTVIEVTLIDKEIIEIRH
ncbi:MAG: penicillin-binding transpeptidase domain-containing protein [Oscillospiraceae bacterium]|nr:penicillin-binding transpeptidase domain-containing protein [Oscillospiraceae bacterium]